ncbi:MAG: phenylacetate--CoA ligase [Dehalococcoidales bacterium]|nr:phenylacetate--CoA ligase [Dehalococcoidales bacterium]
MYWDKTHETMPRAELQTLQLRRLQAKVRDVYEKVPFYREALQTRGLTPDSIKSLNDLAKLPFTTKQDFRDNYPFGLVAVPLENIVRLHASSGTTGKPTVVAYTRGDIGLWADMMARTLTMAGATSRDVVHNAYGYGLFTGGLGIHYGAERIGAAVIPMSGGNSKRQIMLMQDLGSSVLCCTPSYALLLAEVANEMGVDLRNSDLRVGIFGAEPWSYRMRQEIEDKLGILGLDIYGLSEIMGPGVAQECPEKNGLHIFEDHFLAEVVDPQTGEPLPYGQKGELVFTTLTKEGLPVIRYRTRDITSLNPEPCACGRTLVRMEKVTGRTDDMLIVRGVNVFPSQIEGVLLEVEGVEPHYQIIVDRQHTLDDLEIWVEVSEAVFTDEIRRLEDLEHKVRREVESVLGIVARVKLVEPHTIQRSEGKAKRVIDRREL